MVGAYNLITWKFEDEFKVPSGDLGVKKREIETIEELTQRSQRSHRGAQRRGHVFEYYVVT
jgi:hypothetical protein